jgi:MarR family transcriptional regulator, organic hydroperoxide resistance regulator
MKKKMTPAKKKPQSTGPAVDGSLPAPATVADRIVLEIRKFIASAIFFNAQTAEKVGLGLTDMQILHIIQLYGPATPGRIAASTGLTSGGVTVALDRLEKGGFIRRQPNPDDRRSLLIHLNPSRLSRVAGHYEEVERETRRVLATIPQADLEATVRFFETLAQVRDRSEATAKGRKSSGSKATSTK